MNRPTMHSLPVLSALAMIAGCTPESLPQETHVLSLGNDQISVVVYASPLDGLRYVVLHDDENTAAEAALEIVRERGGKFVELRHSGERNVQFSLEGGVYRFDPNRIFTPVGVARTLERWSEAAVGQPAIDAVRTFADTLLALLLDDYSGLIVAVHNNTDDGYSMHSYQSGSDLAAEAQFVHVAGDEDMDDFFFATTDSVYNRLQVAGFHAVLQRMPATTDDGSLSVYAAQGGIPYVNVEAEHGHMEQQLKMLETIVDIH